jgi:hypothetical protein
VEQRVDHDGGVGEARHEAAERQPAHEQEGSRRRRDQVDQHKAERHRLDEVSAVQSESSAMIGGYHDRDRARDQEEDGRRENSGAPVGNRLLPEGFHYETSDRQENGAFEDRRG